MWDVHAVRALVLFTKSISRLNLSKKKNKHLTSCPPLSFAGEAINQFLNQNANELVQEMRPAASQSIAKLFRKFLNDTFSNIPMRLWLLDD